MMTLLRLNLSYTFINLFRNLETELDKNFLSGPNVDGGNQYVFLYLSKKLLTGFSLIINVRWLLVRLTVLTIIFDICYKLQDYHLLTKMYSYFRNDVYSFSMYK